MHRSTTKPIRALVFTILMVNVAVASRAAQSSVCTLEDGVEIEVDGRTFLETGTTLIEVASASMGCLSCHDGTVAPGILNSPGRFRAGGRAESSAPGYDHGDPSRNHPVDIVYPVAEPGYVPRALLDSRLQLDSGLLTCRTCHGARSVDGLAPTSGAMLSIPNEGSRLCFACHDL